MNPYKKYLMNNHLTVFFYMMDYEDIYSMFEDAGHSFFQEELADLIFKLMKRDCDNSIPWLIRYDFLSGYKIDVCWPSADKAWDLSIEIAGDMYRFEQDDEEAVAEYERSDEIEEAIANMVNEVGEDLEDE